MVKGVPLTEAEIDNICEKLRDEEWKNFIKIIAEQEDELRKYRRKYGPLPGKTGKGKTTKNKEIQSNEQ